MAYGYEYVLKGLNGEKSYSKTIKGTKNGTTDQFKTLVRALEKGLVDSIAFTQVTSKQLTVHDVTAGA